MTLQMHANITMSVTLTYFNAWTWDKSIKFFSKFSLDTCKDPWDYYRQSRTTYTALYTDIEIHYLPLNIVIIRSHS